MDKYLRLQLQQKETQNDLKRALKKALFAFDQSNRQSV